MTWFIMMILTLDGSSLPPLPTGSWHTKMQCEMAAKKFVAGISASSHVHFDYICLSSDQVGNEPK